MADEGSGGVHGVFRALGLKGALTSCPGQEGHQGFQLSHLPQAALCVKGG